MRKKNYFFVGVLILALAAGAIVVKAMNKRKPFVDTELVYTEQSVFDDKGNGWIYNFEIIYIDGEEKLNYIFDGYNLKYKPVGKEYYVSYNDLETGKEIDRIPARYATLSTSEVYRNDVALINKYFNEKQFKNKITINDLKDLKITKMDKKYLVDLFNRTISSDIMNESGKYIKAPSLDIKTIDMEDGSGNWQIMYILDYGYISNIEIEFISEDNKNLSDKKDLSSDEKKLLSEIDNLEDRIIKEQQVSSKLVDNSYKVINNEKELKELLDIIDKEVLNIEE
ncbi:MAG: hypothetical protein IKN87_04820 [Bacilli bacterium]|nr:hypothetical protein [Bacilli bacterium]